MPRAYGYELGHEESLQDPRFNDNLGWVAKSGESVAVIQSVIRTAVAAV